MGIETETRRAERQDGVLDLQTTSVEALVQLPAMWTVIPVVRVAVLDGTETTAGLETITVRFGRRHHEAVEIGIDTAETVRDLPTAVVADTETTRRGERPKMTCRFLVERRIWSLTFSLSFLMQ